MNDRPLISVVVPAHDAGEFLPLSIAALLKSDLERRSWELIIVDDASRDHSAQNAASLADSVITLDPPAHGPAYARNRGAGAAKSDIVAFVDADVCVHDDVLRRIVDRFAAEPELGAVFGSYDDTPSNTAFVSQYRNLLHHYVHQRSPGKTESFWAGCGAVRRGPFIEVGKFNEHLYERPEIEDVELGYRFRDAGLNVLLDPSIQGTHLKSWTLGSMLHSDFHHRGVPWTLLLLERGRLLGAKGLSVGNADKISALMVGILAASLVIAVLLGGWWFALPAACIAVLLIVNRTLIAWFARRRGYWFAARAFLMHILYHATNVASVAYGIIVYLAGGGAHRRAAIESK